MHRSFEVGRHRATDLEATQYIAIHEAPEPRRPAMSDQQTQLVDPTDNRQDPLAVRGIVVAIATAAIGVATAFGLHLTKLQEGATLGLVAVAGPLVVAWWARRHVFSPATVNKVLAAARIRRPNP